MPDQILVSGLRVLGTHGVLAEEAARAQPFQLDLAVDVDLGPAVISDALDDALDYAWVAGVAAAIVAERHFSLLEALAEAIAQAILADARASAVAVTVRKLRPPVALDMSSAGVKITRRRN